MKKIIYFLSIAFVMLQGCSSDNNSEDSNNSGTVLLKRLEYSDNSGPIYFKYNGTKLNYYSFGEQTGLLKKQFTYSGNLITKAEWFENGVATGEKDTYTYSNNKLIEHRTYSPGIVLERVENFEYISDGTINLTAENSSGNIVGFAKLYLDPDGNVIKSESSSYFVLYEYDNKNNPYRNITGFSEIFLTDPNYGNNNLTKKIFTNTTYYNYQYNGQNYPISQEKIKPGQTNVIMTYYY